MASSPTASGTSSAADDDKGVTIVINANQELVVDHEVVQKFIGISNICQSF